jgi:pimeloyl-ACP methyl ester carboxylesterase
MEGTKAEAMVEWARINGHAALRFDYSGHGQSSGVFTDGSISRWVEESLAILEQHAGGPQILLGSSMGGWIALRMVQELAKRPGNLSIQGLLLIAPAPDFTAALMEPVFTKEQYEALETRGFIEEPSAYSDEPDIITRTLIEDGRKNLVLDGIINTNCPVRILQGMQDVDVPYDHALRLVNHLPSDDVTITLIKDGDHRLSRDQDIALLKSVLADLSGIAD